MKEMQISKPLANNASFVTIVLGRMMMLFEITGEKWTFSLMNQISLDQAACRHLLTINTSL